MNQDEFTPKIPETEEPTLPVERPPVAEPVEPIPEEVPANEPESEPPIPEDPREPEPPIPEAPPQIEEVPKPAKNGIWMVIAIIALSISLLLGAFAIWAAGKNNQAFQIPQSNTPSYNYRTDVTEKDQLTPQEIIAKVSPSVVTISTPKGFGTGIIYTDNGYILTNAHVVEGATRIAVTDSSGNSYTATLVGADSQSDTAVIKINATGLIAAEFGQSAKVVPGDMVIAIGTPYAENLSYTATQGMVSAIRESLKFPELGYTLDLIQHDAPINQGNSGGPLVNVYGQVIGINSIKISGTYENLGFALQIDEVLPLAEELMNSGKVTRPGIGISGYDNNTSDVKGAYVVEVVPGGAADKAGLQAGDIIIKVDNTTIESIEQLKKVVQSGKIGDSITLTYIRNDAVYSTTAVLQELNQQ